MNSEEITQEYIEEPIDYKDIINYFSEGLTELQKAKYSKYCDKLFDFIEANTDEDGVCLTEVITDFAGHGFAILRHIIKKGGLVDDIPISRIYEKYKEEWGKIINKGKDWDLDISINVAECFIPKQNTFMGNNKLKI